jgi:hypothetical protein
MEEMLKACKDAELWIMDRLYPGDTVPGVVNQLRAAIENAEKWQQATNIVSLKGPWISGWIDTCDEGR